MGLFAPWFLAGLAAVGLPIYLHLLKQHKTEPKPFSSLMFFEKRTQSSIKHRRLRHLILFALRVALLILLALAFANPFIRRSATAASGKRLVIVAVDRSFSMRYGDRLARAKQQATGIVAGLRPGDAAQVLALAGGVQALTQPSTDQGELRAAVQAIQPSDSRASFGELARFLRAQAQSSRMPLEVHLLSDLQKSAMPPGFTDLRLASDTRLELHSLAESTQPNWTVESVAAPRRVYDPKKARVEATVAGFGTPAARRQVSLVVNGKVLATKTADVPASGRGRVEFVALETPYGFSRGEVRIDAGDKLAEDDRYYFAVERADPRKALFVFDARRARAVTYFRAALEASAEAAYQLEPRTTDQLGGLTLSNYAFVVLSDVGPLAPGFEDSLKKYAAAGGSVLVALGSATAVLPRVPVLDEAINESRYASREGERFLSVGEMDEGHPAGRRLNKLAGVKFYQAIRVSAGNARVIARLNDQTPLLLEKPIGEGRVVAFASTFDNISNDFPLHGSFVPFISQISAYLGGGEEQPANVAVDSNVELRRARNQGVATEVTGPDGGRALSLQEAASATSFAVTREGFYEMKLGSGRHEMVAVHADRRESDLAPMLKETLSLWQGTGAGDNSSPGASTQQSGETRPWNLWPYVLLLLLLVAMAESIFGSRYLAAAKEDEEVRKEAA